MTVPQELIRFSHSLCALCFICFVFRIDERRNQVLARREKVKAKCQDRHNQLLASQAYQEFNRDADEVNLKLLKHCKCPGHDNIVMG